MNQARPVIVVEPNATGHRFYYVQILVRYLRDHSIRCVLATSDQAIASESGRRLLVDFGREVDVVTNKQWTLQSVSLLALERGAARTVFPDGDAWILQLSRSRRSWHGGLATMLMMRSEPHSTGYPLLDFARRRVRRAMVSRARRVEEVSILTLGDAGRAHAPSDGVVADPIEIGLEPTPSHRSIARNHFGLPDERFVIAIVGAIDARKNVETVIAAAESVPNATVMLAGQLSTESRNAVSASFDGTNATEILSIDRLLTDLEIDQAVLAADVVVAAHTNEGPSGIVGRALHLGTPVLAAGADSLRVALLDHPDRGMWVPLTVADLSFGLNTITRRRRPIPLLAPSTDEFASALIDEAGRSGPSHRHGSRPAHTHDTPRPENES